MTARRALLPAAATLAVVAAALQSTCGPTRVAVPAALASAPTPGAPPPAGLYTAAPASAGATAGGPSANGDAPADAVAAAPGAAPPVALAAGHPDETSARPTPAQWKTASLVLPTRRSPRSAVCRVYRVREWLKVHCDGLTASIAQLAGNTDDVALWVAPKSDRELFTHLAANGAEAIFPLRRGDRRVFQRFDVSGGAYGGFGVEGGVVIDARWLDIEGVPRLVLR